MATHFVKKFKKKLRIDLKWREMQLKVILVIQNNCHRPFCKKIQRKSYEKASALHNLIKNAPIHFIFDVATDLQNREVPIDFGKNLDPKWSLAAILRIDLKWREIRSKVIFGHPKWPICEQIIL